MLSRCNYSIENFKHEGKVEILKDVQSILSTISKQKIPSEFEVRTPIHFSVKEKTLLLKMLFGPPNTIHGIAKNLEVNPSTIDSPMKKLKGKEIVFPKQSGINPRNKNPKYNYYFTEYGFYVALSIIIQILDLEERGIDSSTAEVNYPDFPIESDLILRSEVLELLKIIQGNHSYICPKIINLWNWIDENCNDIQLINKYLTPIPEVFKGWTDPNQESKYYYIGGFLLPLIRNIYSFAADYGIGRGGTQPKTIRLGKEDKLYSLFDISYFKKLFSLHGMESEYQKHVILKNEELADIMIQSFHLQLIEIQSYFEVGEWMAKSIFEIEKE